MESSYCPDQIPNLFPGPGQGDDMVLACLLFSKVLSLFASAAAGDGSAACCGFIFIMMVLFSFMEQHFETKTTALSSAQRLP